jgi:uncharacterized repeat protein (TIGR03803 family)
MMPCKLLVQFFGIALLLTCLAHGVAGKTLYAFGTPGSHDGMYPWSSVIFDAAGNMYGTTLDGGAYNYGTIFELSPAANGEWTETLIHQFSGPDGENPFGGLTSDAAGNLYGTACCGGTNGTGVVYELTPQNGTWSYRVLYNFGPYPQSGDGFVANSALVFDKAGNMYGTTNEGGADSSCFNGCGTVFELSPVGAGAWTEKVIHTFQADGIDGELPVGGVAIDDHGTLYGTTQNGGTGGSGILFQLKYSPSQDAWTENILHQFLGGATDGSFPEAGVLIYKGALYGTTDGGGENHFGTVYETTYSRATGIVTRIIYSFRPTYSGDGNSPQSGLTVDGAGNIYGTTWYGGAFNYNGTVFRLSRTSDMPGDGTWGETILYSFDIYDGLYPEATPTLHGGRLYGTTSNGGNNAGLVYEIEP